MTSTHSDKEGLEDITRTQRRILKATRTPGLVKHQNKFQVWSKETNWDEYKNESKHKDEEEDVENEEQVLWAADPISIILGNKDDHTSVIIDTGTDYNLIGHHLIPLLKQRLSQVGVELNILPTKNKFQLSERTIIESSGKIVVPILLGKTTVEAEVYIVKTEAPFIIGNKFLRQKKIEVMEDSMTINKHKINLHPLTSGQLALWWDYKLHKLRNLPEQHQWLRQQKLQQQ